jgi:TP901 family phage tail tape measure protein
MAARAPIIAGKTVILLQVQDTVDSALIGVKRKLNKFSASISGIGLDLFKGGVVGSLGLGFILKDFKDFEDRILFLSTKLEATDAQFLKVTDTIRRLGRETSYTANEVADGATSLAQAGFNAVETTNSLGAVLDLARGGQIELSDSAAILANTLTVFSLNTERASEVASQFIVAARKGTLNVLDLKESLKEVVGTLNLLNIDLPTSLALVTQLAQSSLRGTKAGTSLNTALLQLARNQDVLKNSLGIDTVDARGNLLPFIDILDKLLTKLEPLGNARRVAVLQRLFNIRGGRAITGLLRDLERTRDLAKDIRGAGDEARIAAKKMDSEFGGAIRFATSALQDLSLEIGKIVSGPLTKLLRTVPPLANAFQQILQSNPEFVLAIAAIPPAALAAGVGLLSLGFTLNKLGGLIGVVGSGFASLASILNRAFTGPLVAGLRTISAIRSAAGRIDTGIASRVLGPTDPARIIAAQKRVNRATSALRKAQLAGTYTLEVQAAKKLAAAQGRLRKAQSAGSFLGRIGNRPLRGTGFGVARVVDLAQSHTRYYMENFLHTGALKYGYKQRIRPFVRALIKPLGTALSSAGKKLTIPALAKGAGFLDNLPKVFRGAGIGAITSFENKLKTLTTAIIKFSSIGINSIESFVTKGLGRLGAGIRFIDGYTARLVRASGLLLTDKPINTGPKEIGKVFFRMGRDISTALETVEFAIQDKLRGPIFKVASTIKAPFAAITRGIDRATDFGRGVGVRSSVAAKSFTNRLLGKPAAFKAAFIRQLSTFKLGAALEGGGIRGALLQGARQTSGARGGIAALFSGIGKAGGKTLPILSKLERAFSFLFNKGLLGASKGIGLVGRFFIQLTKIDYIKPIYTAIVAVKNLSIGFLKLGGIAFRTLTTLSGWGNIITLLLIFGDKIEFIRKGMERLGTGISDAFRTIFGTFKDATDTFSLFGEGVRSLIRGDGTIGINQMSEAISLLGTIIKSNLTIAFNQIKIAVAPAFDFLRQGILSTIELFKLLGSIVGVTFSNIGGGLNALSGGGAGSLMESITSLIKQAFDPENIKIAFRFIGQVFSELAKSINSIFEGIFSLFANIGSTILRGFESLFTAIDNSVIGRRILGDQQDTLKGIRGGTTFTRRAATDTDIIKLAKQLKLGPGPALDALVTRLRKEGIVETSTSGIKGFDLALTQINDTFRSTPQRIDAVNNKYLTAIDRIYSVNTEAQGKAAKATAEAAKANAKELALFGLFTADRISQTDPNNPLVKLGVLLGNLNSQFIGNAGLDGDKLFGDDSTLVRALFQLSLNLKTLYLSLLTTPPQERVH